MESCPPSGSSRPTPARLEGGGSGRPGSGPAKGAVLGTLAEGALTVGSAVIAAAAGAGAVVGAYGAGSVAGVLGAGDGELEGSAMGVDAGSDGAGSAIAGGGCGCGEGRLGRAREPWDRPE